MFYSYLSFNGIFSQRKVDIFLLLLDCLSCGFELGQSSTDSTSLLHTPVQRSVLALLMEQLDLSSLVLVDDCKNTGNRFTDTVDLSNFVCSSSSYLLDS